MRRNYIKYIASIFFICLFLFKGIATTLPSLVANISGNGELALFIDIETENNKKNAEERIDTEIKEFYLHHHSANDALSALLIADKKTGAHHSWYQQSDYTAIPTPPPELI